MRPQSLFSLGEAFIQLAQSNGITGPSPHDEEHFVVSDFSNFLGSDRRYVGKTDCATTATADYKSAFFNSDLHGLSLRWLVSAFHPLRTLSYEF